MIINLTKTRRPRFRESDEKRLQTSTIRQEGSKGKGLSCKTELKRSLSCQRSDSRTGRKRKT